MELISPIEAAKRLKKHKSTIYRRIKRGEVKTEPIPAEIGVFWDGEAGDLVKAD